MRVPAACIDSLRVETNVSAKSDSVADRRLVTRFAASTKPWLLVALLIIASAPACKKRTGGGGGGTPVTAAQMLEHWNQVSIDASGLDHTPSTQGPPHDFGQQVGPGRSSRAIAIVHIAMFEAMNSIKRKYESYVGFPVSPANTSMLAAVGQAAHDTLVALYPSQSAIFADHLALDLSKVPHGAGRTNGIQVGKNAAAAILQMRAGDGSELPEPLMHIDYIPSDQPGFWRQDPISMHPLALGADWDLVTPFLLASADQFRAPPPPAMSSPEYAAAFNEAKSVGGDGITTATVRDEERTFIGIYWAYDGTPSLCAPPRLYNQIAMQIAAEQGTDEVDLARLLALVNVSMADTGIGVWESKYFYEFWRPVTGIRESEAGTGPSGIGDGNPATIGDATFTPLGAPASNLTGPNFTPPFPAYPSGHAGFGGALFQTLRRFYGTDEIPFTFVSDEYNGETLDHDGMVRPLIPRTFLSLSEAEEENGQSRMYLGIHWAFDKVEGIALGRKTADYVFDNSFRPL
ncbi:MAG: vanadium-dependent haloperoxidase [Planctomycetota bacterium]